MMTLQVVVYVLLMLIKCHFGYQYQNNNWNPGYYYYHNHHQVPQEVMVDAVNSLALKLLAIHNENNANNIAISPYGALTVLVALGEGLHGEAADEIRWATNIPTDISVIRVGLRDIHRHLKSYFIPEEGFLSGLTLSNDNVTLNPDFEDILKFYGFDINSFNSALYPEIGTTPKNNESVTTTTTELTTTGISVSDTDRMMRTEPTTLQMQTTTLPTTTTVQIDTTTLPTTTNTQTVEMSSPTSFRTETTSEIITTAEIESTTEKITTTTVKNEENTERSSITTRSVPENSETPEMTTVAMPTETTAPEMSTTTTPPEIPTEITTETSERTTQLRENEKTTESMSTTSELPTTTEKIENQASTETTQTITEENTTLETTTTNNIETSTVATNEKLQRATRSVVDYIIARYYDDHSITQRPPPPQSDVDDDNGLNFLVNGKYREPNVSYMTYDTVLPFHYSPHLHTLALRFPLDSSKYYLLLLLPEHEANIDQVICNLRLNTDLKHIISNMRYTRVRAQIPSFMLKGYVVLTSTFQKMGIRKVFEPRQADFSPMTKDKDIYVTNVEQAITVTIRNYMDPHQMNDHRYLEDTEPVYFKADHPFLYFVIDSEIDLALMAGKISNPLNSRIR